MSKALLVACSIILVLVLFGPIVVWSQTVSIFTVIGTVVDSNRAPADNGLVVVVQNTNTSATIYGVTGEVSNNYLLSNEIIIGKGQFAVVFPPYESGKAAVVGDKIIVQIPDLYEKTFSYTVTQADIDSGEMKLRIPYYTFTLSLVKGFNLISIPLANATVERNTVKLERVSDLGKLLGDSWNLIISSDCNTGVFLSYTPTTPFEAPSNVKIDGYTGLIVLMKEAKNIKIIGKGWDLDQKILSGTCTNIIGIPLEDDNITRVSDLGQLLGDSWDLIISYDREGKPQSYTPTTPLDAKSNIVITGGKGLIVVTKKPVTFSITGKPWSD